MEPNDVSSLLQETRVVIVNWNLKDDTIACIRSLLDAGLPAEHIHLVDNGSQDGSAQAVRAAFSDQIEVLETGENLGLSGGINVGLRAVLPRGGRWILLLNNDTLVEAGMFPALDRAVKRHPEVALWGPRILYADDPARTWFLGERRIAGTLLGRPVPQTRLADESGAAPLAVDFLSGCAMLVRVDVFERIGGFDPTYFLFAEEVDFCWRATQAGFHLAAQPQARLLHKVSLSTGKDKPLARRLRIRSQIWFYRRYAGVLQRVFLFAFTGLRALRLAIGDLISGHTDLAIASLRGWWQGWMVSRRRFIPPRTDLAPPD